MKDSKKILIVDDEARNRILLEALLESMGYEGQCVGDGFEALACLSPQIDLVLLDVMMPGLDGYEVARRIRSGGLCPDIPIIMVTSLSSAEDRVKAAQAGANAFVTKPIDKLDLRLSIANLLNGQEGEHSL